MSRSKSGASILYKTFARGYQSQNGTLAASVFALNRSSLRSLALSSEREIRSELLSNGTFGSLTSGPEVMSWVDVFTCFWKVAGALVGDEEEDWVKAWEAQKDLVLAVIRGFQNSQWPNYLLPVLYQTSNNLRILAIRADTYILATSKISISVEQLQEKLEDAARVINRGFTICISDRAPLEESRKWGTYYMSNLLFKTYFKLNTISLTKNILRAIDASTSDLPSISVFPSSQGVTFWYYLGVVNFLEGKYEEAEKNLMLALDRCYAKAKKQRELILMYLIPTRLLTKQLLPTKALLSQYPRLEALYLPFTQCIKAGNLKMFDEALAAGEEEFVKWRIYLTLERGREVVLRNLFRKAYLLQPAEGQAKTRVPLEIFRVAVELSSGAGKGETEVEEVECLLANMICSGYMKGYISREHSKVVLSQRDPFPGTKVEE